MAAGLTSAELKVEKWFWLDDYRRSDDSAGNREVTCEDTRLTCPSLCRVTDDLRQLISTRVQWAGSSVAQLVAVYTTVYKRHNDRL